MASLKTTRKRFRAGLPLLICLLVTIAGQAGILTIRNHLVEKARQTEIEAIRVETRAKAVALRETLSRTLDQVATMQSIAGLVTKARQSGNVEMEKAALTELSARRGIMSSKVTGIIGVNPDLYWEWSNQESKMRPSYFGDRAHLRAIASGAATEAVGDPVRGLASGLLIIPFAKGVYGTGGNLLGVTVVAVETGAFHGLAATMGVTGRDSLTMVRADGMVLARSDGEGVGDRIAAANPLLRTVLDNEHSLRQGVSPIDGIERIFASERLGTSGLSLAVGLDLRSRLDRLKPEIDRIWQEAMETGLLLGLLGAAAIAAWYWRRSAAEAEAGMAIIRKSETLFRQLAEAMPDLIRVLDRNGIVLYASPASRDLLGVDPGALVGKQTGRFVHPDDLQAMGQRELRLRQDLRQTSSDVRLVRQDGRIIQVQTTLQRIGGNDRRPGLPAIVSSSRDVTEERQAEAALRQTTEALDAALTASSGALFRAKRDGMRDIRVLFVSDSVETITGFTAAEVMAVPNWLETRRDPSGQTPGHAGRCRPRIEGRSTAHHRIQHKNRSWIWIELFSQSLGEGRGVVGYLRDVTLERERELQVARVAQLTTLGELTTGMAHELNQPLAAMSMVAQNVMTVLDVAQPNHAFLNRKLERIIDQVQRAASIINHMRAFGRRGDDPPASIRVADAVDAASSIVQAGLHQAGFSLVSHVEPGLPPVTGQAVSLEQVLMNLIGNAASLIGVDAAPLPDERRRIEIAARLEAGAVVVTVAGHAGGIDESLLPRIFEPFSPATPGNPATGLGLSISYEIVTAMHGVIAARNECDGAVFEIRLPPALQPEADVTDLNAVPA